MHWFIDFLALALIEIFIVDISGAIQGMIHPVIRKLLKTQGNIHIPLIECSLCVVFHTGWIFLLCTGNFTLINFMITTMIAFLSKNIEGFLRLIQELLVKLESRLYDIFKLND